MITINYYSTYGSLDQVVETASLVVSVLGQILTNEVSHKRIKTKNP